MRLEIKKTGTEKWKYILKIGVLWAFIISTCIYVIQLLTGEVDTNISIWIYSVFAILTGSLVILPFGIIMGIIMWKRKIM